MVTWPWKLGEGADEGSSNARLVVSSGERLGMGGREGNGHEGREKNFEGQTESECDTEECYG